MQSNTPETDAVSITTRAQRSPLSNQRIFFDLMKIAGPPIIENLILYSGDFVRGIVLARNGLVLASSLIFPFQRTVVLSSIYSMNVLQPLLNKADLAPESVGCILQQAATYSLMISIPLCSVLFSAGYILDGLGYKVTDTDSVKFYFNAYLPSLPATLILNSQWQLFLSKDNPLLLIPLSIMNTVLYLLFLYLFASEIKLSVAGIGLAQTSQAYTSLLISTLYLYFTKRFAPFNLFSRFSQETMVEALKSIFHLGIPLLLEIAAELMAGIILSLLIGRISTIQLATYHIAHEYMIWLGIPAVGLAGAVSVNIARNDVGTALQNIKPIGMMALKITTALLVPFSIISIFLSEQLCRLFLQESNPNHVAIVDNAKVMLPLIISLSLPLSWTKLSAAALRGLKDTKSPFLISFLSTYLITIGIGVLLYSQGYAAQYLNITQLIGATCTSIGIFLRWNFLTTQRQYSLSTKANLLSLCGLFSNQNQSPHSQALISEDSSLRPLLNESNSTELNILQLQN